VPAIDTVTAKTVNWCWTVLGGLLSFNALQADETTGHNNNRSHAVGGVWEVLSKCRMTFRDHQYDQPEPVTRCLKWQAWWHGEGETVVKQVGADKRSIKLNKNYETAGLTSMGIIVTVQVWQAGADGIRRDH
jgi:hypothetical protein